MSCTEDTGPSSRTDRDPVEDWRGLGDLVSLATDRLTAPVEGMHDAIGDRWFGLAGSSVAPVKRAYRTFTSGVYGSVRMTASALGTAIGLAAEAADRHNEPPSLWGSPMGSGIQAAVNALWGDELERRRSPLHVDLGLRDSAGQTIDVHQEAIADAFPHPTSRLLVLVHGLGETEGCWWRQEDDDETRRGLGETLAADAFTPLSFRYNTGRHVSDNGLDLAELIEDIARVWPVPVDEIAVVGNSMGGLVVRSAVHVGGAAGHAWPRAVRHIVTVGAPHLGAPLEKGTNLVSWGLRIAPESRPIGEFLDLRSSGIKDLRFGAVREADWHGADPDALLRDVVGDVSLPDGVAQHFVAGVITADPTHPVGVLVGDLVVRAGSGTGRGRSRRVEATHLRVFGGMNHTDLLHDPAVHEQIRQWFGAESGDRSG